MSFRDPEWCKLQAGEYVLGTLSAREKAEFEEELHYDRGLQELVVDWQEHFQPLADAMPPIEAPLWVWANIVDRIQQEKFSSERTRFAERTPRKRRTRQPQTSNTGWQVLASLATAASLILGVMLWNQYQQPSAPTYDSLAILSADDSKPLWIVDASVKDQQIRITTVAAPDIEDTQVHQLWMIKPDNAGVLSLGLLPRTLNTTIIVVTNGLSENAVALAVSLEPAGGSTEPGPSGPVLYQGEFNNLINTEL